MVRDSVRECTEGMDLAMARTEVRDSALECTEALAECTELPARCVLCSSGRYSVRVTTTDTAPVPSDASARSSS